MTCGSKHRFIALLAAQFCCQGQMTFSLAVPFTFSGIYSAAFNLAAI